MILIFAKLFFPFLMGLILGMLGGGGSILTVPILVEIYKFETKTAIASSLLLVALSSLFGFFAYQKRNKVLFKVALMFCSLSFFGSYFGTKVAFFISNTSQMILFASIMAMSAIYMLFSKAPQQNQTQFKHTFISLGMGGMVLGFLTGLLGVGGGFIIVPALMWLTGIDMLSAIGTSLLIIFINCVFGSLHYAWHVHYPFKQLLPFLICSILGLFAGLKLSKTLKAGHLKKTFAFLLIILSTWIIYKNCFQT